MDDLAWLDRSVAACTGHDPEDFFPSERSEVDSSQRTERAKAICRPCPLRRPCLGHAMSHLELLGVWGATTTKERRDERKKATKKWWQR